MKFETYEPKPQLSIMLVEALALAIVLTISANDCQAKEGAEKLSFSQTEEKVSIRIDGELFTEYLTQSGVRPVLWPIIGPTSEHMTRAYPVAPARDKEEKDHIHHRSMWIGYEGFNAHDYWHEKEKHVTRPFPIGKVLHRKFSSVETVDNTVVIVAENDWLGEKDRLICSDTRTLRFGCQDGKRWIDVLLDLHAKDGPIEIGDSKEGFFALRVAPTMRVDAGLGGKIIASSGKSNEDVWGQRAEWVDYSGPIAGKTVGIAILSHPKSFVPAPRWHVRTYGLFAANPFGEVAFTDPESDMTKRSLIHTVAKNNSLRFRYRVIFHKGTEKDAQIAKEYQTFAAEPLVETN